MAVILAVLAVAGTASAFLAPTRLPVATRPGAIAGASFHGLRLAPTAGRIACRPAFSLQMVGAPPRVDDDINEADFFGEGESSDVAAKASLADSAYVEASETETEGEEEGDPLDVSNFPICDQTMDSLAQRGITKLFPVQGATFH